MRIGYFLSSEEYTPAELIEQARRRRTGRLRAPCGSPTTTTRGTTRRGRAPFVWSMIGALSQVCTLPVTTAVTCPTVRIHPAVIAQAAATSAVLHGGRFRLGVGTGEALNEHIFGDAWPEADVRLEMLEEAVEVMRRAVDRRLRQPPRQALHRGERPHLHAARARRRRSYVSGVRAEGRRRWPARIGDGYMSTMPDGERSSAFRTGGGGDKPCQAGFKAAFAAERGRGRADRVRAVAQRRRAGRAVPGAAVAEALRAGAPSWSRRTWSRRAFACGNGRRRAPGDDRQYAEAGFDEVYVANTGPHWQGLFDLYAEHVLPDSLR